MPGAGGKGQVIAAAAAGIFPAGKDPRQTEFLTLRQRIIVLAQIRKAILPRIADPHTGMPFIDLVTTAPKNQKIPLVAGFRLIPILNDNR